MPFCELEEDSFDKAAGFSNSRLFFLSSVVAGAAVLLAEVVFIVEVEVEVGVVAVAAAVAIVVVVGVVAVGVAAVFFEVGIEMAGFFDGLMLGSPFFGESVLDPLSSSTLFFERGGLEEEEKEDKRTLVPGGRSEEIFSDTAC